MDTKLLTRKIRVVRLYLITSAYSNYTKMEMNRNLIKYENNYESALESRDMANIFFPIRDFKIEDFVYDKNEISDYILGKYKNFKKFLELAEIAGTPQRALIAFCKHVNNTCAIYDLRLLGSIHYPMFFKAIYDYLECKIDKKQLMESLVELKLFNKEKTPISYSCFRKVVIEIEKLLNEIMKKQDERISINLKKTEKNRTL